MEPTPQRPKEQNESLSDSLGAAIEALNLTKEVLSITPAKAVFGAVGALLALIRVCLLCNDWMFQVHRIYLGHHGQ
jgi:hypothetical protein